MRRSPRWSVLILGAVIVLLLFTFPLWRTILRSGSNAERPFPIANEAQREIFLKMPDRNLAATAYVAMLTPVPVPTQDQPPSAPLNVDASLSGTFVVLDAVHGGEGEVNLFRLVDGTAILRFEDSFKVTNAPGLAVYLSGAEAPITRSDMGSGAPEFLVGNLKGSFGSQQFNVPKELDLTRYKSVVLYSEIMGRIYSSARLR